MREPIDPISQAPRAALVSFRLPAPTVSLASFLRLPLPGEALLWRGRGEDAIAARGAVARLDLEAGESLASLGPRAAWSAEVDRRTLDPSTAHADEPGSEPGLRWYGGAAFAPGASGDEWRGFGAASFVLPRLAYEPGPGGVSWLRLNLRADEMGEVASWLDRLATVLLTLAHAVPGAGDSQGRVLREHGDDYERTVARAVGAIEAGVAEKIVAARALEVAVEGDVLTPIERLDDDALVSFVFGRDDALFFGATPERLVRLDGRTVRTEALAGSIAADEPAAGDRLLASTKDAHEHHLVVGAIVSALGPLCDSLTAAASPGLRRLRHLLHLVTPIEGQTSARHVLELVTALHPTPAVGGLPRESALAWLAANEGLDRGWYAGPVGWFDARGQGSFAVALRSALRRGELTRVFAGAGLVRGSTPESERRETAVKARAMLAALGVTS